MYTAHERLYLNADKSKVVKEGDPDARFLLVAEGGEITDDEAREYGLMGEHAHRDMPAAMPAADEAKAQAPASNKARARAEDK
jgi:hypothetical protein